MQLSKKVSKVYNILLNRLLTSLVRIAGNSGILSNLIGRER